MRANAAEAIAALAVDLGERARKSPEFEPFAQILKQGVGAENAPLPEAPPNHPARAHLATVMSSMAGASSRLLSALSALQESLRWRQVFDGDGAPPTVAEGMLAAQIAGPVGLVAAEGEGCAGLFLIAPGVSYPLHTHQASEIYYCLHGRLTLQYGTEAEPFDLTPGEIGYTPSNRVHSLKTGAEPALLLYSWIGDLNQPNWLWEAAPDGNWSRANWTRRPDGSWAKVTLEPVTAELLADANGATL